MKKNYIHPTTTVTCMMHHQPLLLITSTGNDKGLKVGGEYDDIEEPR